MPKDKPIAKVDTARTNKRAGSIQLKALNENTTILKSTVVLSTPSNTANPLAQTGAAKEDTAINPRIAKTVRVILLAADNELEDSSGFLLTSPPCAGGARLSEVRYSKAETTAPETINNIPLNTSPAIK